MGRNITLLVLFILLTGMSAIAQVPSNGLVAYYPFKGNANDSTANANNGIVHNALLTNNRFGVANSAYLFSDTSNYIKIPDNIVLHMSSELTLSFWIYQTGISDAGYSRLLDKCTSSTADGWLLDTYPGGKRLRFLAGIDSKNNLSDYSINNWHHIGITYKSGTVTFYVDGVFQNQATLVVTSLPVNNLPIMLGNTQLANSNKLNFIGKMDDLGIWNRALLQQEITSIYLGCHMPNVNLIASDTTTFCSGDSVVFTSTMKGSKYTYTWQRNGFTINGAKSSSYTALQSGSYILIVDSSSCSSVSPAKVVTVNPLPTGVTCSITPYINIENTSVPIAGSPMGGTFSGTGVSGSSFNPAIGGLGLKKIQYAYTNSFGCTNSATTTTLVYDTIKCYVKVTDTLVINAKLSGVNPPDNYNIIKIYPNPAKDYITINYGKYVSMNGYTLKILSSGGQTVFTTSINQQLTNINLSTWKGKGIYFVQLIDNLSNIIEIRKIVLE